MQPKRLSPERHARIGKVMAEIRDIRLRSQLDGGEAQHNVIHVAEPPPKKAKRPHK